MSAGNIGANGRTNLIVTWRCTSIEVLGATAMEEVDVSISRTRMMIMNAPPYFDVALDLSG